VILLATVFARAYPVAAPAWAEDLSDQSAIFAGRVVVARHAVPCNG
jgi:hypothetical protein